MDGPHVDGPIVLHRSQLPILLLDKEGSGVRALQWSYGSPSEMLLEEHFKFFLFKLG